MKENKRLIQSIKRGSDILSVFLETNTPLGITDFSKKFSMPKSTIQSLVKTLEFLNYLEKDPVTSKYRLGPMVFRLGMAYATNMDIVNIGKVWMERLCFQFREPVNVGMLVGDKVVVVLRIDPENKFMMFPQTGSVIPTHSTCIGKIICANLDTEKQADILENYTFEKFTEKTIGSFEKFMEEIKMVRQKGISFEKQESVMGMAGIGAPIYNHTNQVIAAFAITGNADNIKNQQDRIVESVRYTSEQFSRQLGFDGGKHDV
jgi:IclR family transcriptional regulator, KDG regulon repressor